MTQEVDNVDELELMLAELEMESQLAAEAEVEPVPEVEPAAKVVKAAPIIDEDVTDVDLAAELLVGLGLNEEVEIDPPFVPVIPDPKPVRRNKPRPLKLDDEKPVETTVPSTELTDEELADLELSTEPSDAAPGEGADVEAALNSLETAPVVQQPKKTAKGPSPRQRMEAIAAAQAAELEAEAASKNGIEAEHQPDGTPEDKEDAELAELLKNVEDTKPPVAASTTAPVGASGGGSAKTIRPVFNPSGDLKTFIDPDRLQEDLSFTTTNISMAMTRQAAMFAHYSNLAAQATYQSDRAKQQVELHEATLDQRFRDSLVTAGTKFTETSLKALIVQDTTYQAAQIRAHEARAIAKMVETAADSFRHRRDMLIQVGADIRQEKQGKVLVKEHPGDAAVRSMESN